MGDDENGSRGRSGLDLDNHAVLTVLPTPVVVTGPLDQGLPIIFVNQAFTDLTGYAIEESVGRGWAFLAGEGTDQTVVTELFWAIVERRRIRRDLLVHHRDGSAFWVEIAASPALRLQPGGGVVLALNDVSRRYNDATREREAVSYLAGVVRNMPGFIFRYAPRPDGTVEYSGAPEFVVDPTSRSARLTSFDLFGQAHPEDVERAQSALSQSIANRAEMNTELRIRTAGGEDRWVRVYAAPKTEGEDIVWYGVGIDVTGEKSAALRLDYLGKHDLLTGLADRYQLVEAIGQAVVQARASGETFHLSHVKLTRLGEICETLGPTDGDAALRAAAARIIELAVNGHGLVARIATEEFAIFRRCRPGDQDDHLCPALMNELSLPVALNEHYAMLDPIAGSARLSPGEMEGVRPEIGRNRADAARIDRLVGGAALRDGQSPALPSGRGPPYPEPDGAAPFAPSGDHGRRIRAALPADRRSPERPDRRGRGAGAVAAPPASAWSGRTCSSRSLRKSGLIAPLGDLVMRKALRQLRAWRDAGIELPLITINVSPVQV